jgi:hypothetical protein
MQMDKQKWKIALPVIFDPGSAIFLCRIVSNYVLTESLGSFQDAGDPDEDDSADKGDDDRANHSAGRPNVQSAEEPAAKPTAYNAEKDVHDDAVAATFHHQSCEPSSDKTYNEPIDHELPPLSKIQM